MSSKKTKVINPPIQEPQNQPQTQPTAQQENKEEDDVKIQAPKKKRVVSEKTLEALKKGREALNKKWQEDKLKNKELEEKYAIKKANKIIKQKMNIKKKYDVDENDTEEEEPIVIKQEKKPKKKQIIMMPPESDSEEEIVYKKPLKPRQQQTPQPKPQQPAPAPAGRIFFF
jgi:hypothetical protein